MNMRAERAPKSEIEQKREGLSDLSTSDLLLSLQHSVELFDSSKGMDETHVQSWPDSVQIAEHGLVNISAVMAELNRRMHDGKLYESPEGEGEIVEIPPSLGKLFADVYRPVETYPEEFEGDAREVKSEKYEKPVEDHPEPSATTVKPRGKEVLGTSAEIPRVDIPDDDGDPFGMGVL